MRLCLNYDIIHLNTASIIVVKTENCKKATRCSAEEIFQISRI